MKFGILYWPTRTGDYPADRHFQEIAELARAARDSGFDLFAVPNIYLASPARFFHPLPLLAALAPETGNMSLLTGIFLLALQNPVDVAEQAATLDAVSGGRFILGVGVGRRHIPCAEFGIEPAHRGARTGEALQVIKRLWTEDQRHPPGPAFHRVGSHNGREARTKASSAHMGRRNRKQVHPQGGPMGRRLVPHHLRLP